MSGVLRWRWPPEFVQLVEDLYWRGLTCLESAEAISAVANRALSRHAIAGKRRRLGLRGRPRRRPALQREIAA